MTAPAAPVLWCHTDGTKVYVRWQPVANATDYKVYADSTIHPTALEVDVADDEVGTDGWFAEVFLGAGDVYVRLTALDLLAEESGYSNEAHLVLSGPGVSHGQDSSPF